MENLVITHEAQAVTTSLLLAEAFGKNHRDVLEKISSKINSAENSAQYKKMFAESTYTDRSGKQNKMYYLNRDGFTFIAMGFTGRKADEFKLKYIEAFNRMEQALKEQQATPFKLPQNYHEALLQLAEQVEINEANQPKVDYYDEFLSNKGLITTTLIAKQYGMSAMELNKFLHAKGVIYKESGKKKAWVLYANYAGLGLADYEEYAPNERTIRKTLKWTAKGERFIRDLLAEEGIKTNTQLAEKVALSEPEIEYNGPYFSASEIAWQLRLPNEWVKIIGELANREHLKPTFTDSNIFCRKVTDEYGRLRWEYTKYGARKIEAAINEELSKNVG